MIEYFTTVSATDAHSRALDLRSIIEKVVKPGLRVLDAGCGSGILSVWAAQSGDTVIGVDMADLSVAHNLAGENDVAGRTTFIQGDLLVALYGIIQ